MGKQYPLEGDFSTVEEVTARLAASCPPGTKIVSLEKVSTGGLLGFGARTTYEAVVEEPDAPKRPTQMDAFLPRRSGIEALLATAHESEATHHGVQLPAVSTSSQRLGDLLGGLTAETFDPQQPAEVPVPTPVTAAGDLVVVVGLGSDALTAAQAMAGYAGATVYTGGNLSGGAGRVDDRNSAVTARADAVVSGTSIVVAYGLGARPTAATTAKALPTLSADQVWLAVDATSKPADTADWASVVRKTVPVHALMVLRAEETLSPETINELDLPVGFMNGAPATKAVI